MKTKHPQAMFVGIVVGLLFVLTIGAVLFWGGTKQGSLGLQPEGNVSSRAEEAYTLSLAGLSATPAPVEATIPDAGQNNRQSKSLQTLPQIEQQSLWLAFHAARLMVQPLTEQEAAMPLNEGVRFFASNPGQGLTARFLDGAVRIESGRGDEWAATLAYGSGQTVPVAMDDRVEFRHPEGVTEWYVNRAEGIEHGFTLAQRPAMAGEGELQLTFNLNGLAARLVMPEANASNADAVEFVIPVTDEAVLRYDKLVANDATGRELPARFVVNESSVTILVADAGAAYPVTIDPLISSLEAKLARDYDGDGQSGDRFGSAVAIYGDTVAIGAYLDDLAVGNDAGSTYVFVRDGTIWKMQAKLSASDGGASDGFGFAVALFGDRLLIGAPFDDTAGGANAGAAYAFERSGTSWSEQAKLEANDAAANDYFAYSVGLSTNSAVLGAYLDDTTASDTGSAYVFAVQGGAWTQQQKLLASDKAAADRFGSSVAISGNSIVIGAPRNDNSRGSDAGAAYVFTNSGASWGQQAKLLASGAGGAGDYFGVAVAIDGDTTLVGADYYDYLSSIGSIGAAYVFVRSGITWSQQARLTASDAMATDRIGSSLAISGNTALVGAYRDETPAGVDAGSAYVFVRTGSSWSQQAKLEAPDAATSDQFGRAVALHGDTAIIGVWVDVTSAGFYAGSAHVYLRSNGVWGHQAKLTSGDANSGEYFGRTVALSGDTALVGAGADSTATAIAVGAAYVFVRSGTIWELQAKLTASDGGASDGFGGSLALSADTALVGAAGDSAGSAYVFLRSGTNWSQQAKLVASDGVGGDAFGNSLARIFHTGIEQRSGECIQRLELIEPNETASHRFLCDRL